MEPDAIIRVRFKTPEENGRKSAIKASYYSCPMLIDGEYFDCRLLLAGREVELGLSYEIPVQFLRPDLVLSKLTKGKSFVLWEGKDVASGDVLEILTSSEVES